MMGKKGNGCQRTSTPASTASLSMRATEGKRPANPS